MSLYSLYERIPSDWIALGIGCLAAWVYLKLISKVRSELSAEPTLDLVSDVFFAYVLFSRFAAGLLVGFDFNLKNDLLSMINGSARYGWFIGVVAVAVYLSFKFYRRTYLQSKESLWLSTEVFLFGGVFVFAYLGATSLHPFRMEAVVRGLGMFLLWLFTLRGSPNLHVTALLWIGISVLLLASSMAIPQTVIWLWFTPAQWVYVTSMTAAYVAFIRWYNGHRDASVDTEQ